LGWLFEGETVLLLAGFAAHRGYLNPLAVVAIAETAGFTVDQIAFLDGPPPGTLVDRPMAPAGPPNRADAPPAGALGRGLDHRYPLRLRPAPGRASGDRQVSLAGVALCLVAVAAGVWIWRRHNARHNATQR